MQHPWNPWNMFYPHTQYKHVGRHLPVLAGDIQVSPEYTQKLLVSLVYHSSLNTWSYPVPTLPGYHLRPSWTIWYHHQYQTSFNIMKNIINPPLIAVIDWCWPIDPFLLTYWLTYWFHLGVNSFAPLRDRGPRQWTGPLGPCDPPSPPSPCEMLMVKSLVLMAGEIWWMFIRFVWGMCLDVFGVFLLKMWLETNHEEPGSND